MFDLRYVIKIYYANNMNQCKFMLEVFGTWQYYQKNTVEIFQK